MSPRPLFDIYRGCMLPLCTPVVPPPVRLLLLLAIGALFIRCSVCRRRMASFVNVYGKTLLSL